ncbi:MAG: MBL fold metallo-hydrolase [Vicinamibacterales bacterium]
MNARYVLGVVAVAAVILHTPIASAQERRTAEPGVAARNRQVLSELPFADRQDFDDAMRGFVATVPDSATPDGSASLQDSAPDTVNPSLWRLAQLNAIHGLFKVVDGMYQVRGFSLANMTIVEGRTGLIVVDPLSTVASAKAALDLYFAHRPHRQVLAVIYTHSHSDHYGGAKGVASDADVKSGRTRVIAPAGFLDAAVSESVLAGNAMGRRAQYQFGAPLPRGPQGNVDAGLGKIDSRGQAGRSLLAPTDSIERPVETPRKSTVST